MQVTNAVKIVDGPVQTRPSGSTVRDGPSGSSVTADTGVSHKAGSEFGNVTAPDTGDGYVASGLMEDPVITGIGDVVRAIHE